ncbi:MAG: WbqC family protein [Chitinivibrionia bacterium]|nr:WbqC family protein [Chitinivibrionia bacterium]
MKKVAVLQSNYIPWKGYFDIISQTDEFIFYDDVQYTKHNWRNRNKIKTKNGLLWLSVPVGESQSRLVCEVEIPNNVWQKKHWQTIEQFYKKAPYFKEYKDFFENFYLNKIHTNLSEMNKSLTMKICKDILGIKTKFKDSRKFNLHSKKEERLLELLQKANADYYLSGPAAKDYIDERHFADKNIKLEYMDYSGYPEYPQLFGQFEHGVSILDLIFSVGKDSPYYVYGWRNK